jgi:hypothetical protein
MTPIFEIEPPATVHRAPADLKPSRSAVWSAEDQYFYLVDVTPLVLDGAVLVTYVEGVTAHFSDQDLVPVAVSLLDAFEWNQQRSAEVAGPWGDLDSDAEDRRFAEDYEPPGGWAA